MRAIVVRLMLRHTAREKHVVPVLDPAHDAAAVEDGEAAGFGDVAHLGEGIDADLGGWVLAGAEGRRS